MLSVGDALGEMMSVGDPLGEMMSAIVCAVGH